jgi:dipeptidase E
MKIYASSFGLCSEPARLRNLFGNTVRVAVISNALDFSSDHARRDRRVERELSELSDLGLQPAPVDLRTLFGDPTGARSMLKQYDGVWVIGGNAFTLRRALRYSGLDQGLQEIARSDTSFVYAGYSAGSCVLGPTLAGIHLVDPPNLPADSYGTELIMEGLGMLPYSIAPHFQSDHPESRMIDEVVMYFETHGMPYRTLRDGESIVISE